MILAVDTESTRDGRLLCISYDAGDNLITGVDWLPLIERQQRMIDIRNLLEDPTVDKVFHNAKYDLQVLRDHDFKVEGKIHDTMIMAKVVEERLPSYSLKHLGYYLLGDFHKAQLAMEEWFVQNKEPRYEGDMGLLPRGILESYTLKDVDLTIRLFQVLMESICKLNLVECYTTEMALLKPVIEMESNGLLIDHKWVRWHKYKLETKIKSLREEGKLYVTDASEDEDSKIGEEFNPNSIPQIARVLITQGFSVPLTDKGNPKLDKKTRKNIDHPLVKIKGLLEENQKIARTYCRNLITATASSPTVYPNFRISFAATRRFSSAGIGSIKLNWQNFPEEMRRAVCIPKGRVGWFFDYSQIENIIHIFFSEDAERRKAYEADPNWSEYLWLAERILHKTITKEDPDYKRIKSTKLGMNYGLGSRKFAAMNGIPGNEARRLYDTVSRACPAIKRLQSLVEEMLEEHGYVRDVFGYIYHGPSRMAYKVVAYLIQGCAAALMKHAIIRASQIPGVRLHLTVHDELFFSTIDNPSQWTIARKVKHAMTDFSELFDGIPIRVTTYRSTTNWKDKVKVTL